MLNRFAEQQPAFYTMISSIGSIVSYIVSTLLMIGVANNIISKYDIACTVLAASTHFAVLVYFFWLLITVLMQYFTAKFQLNNFEVFFQPLAIVSLGE